MPFPQNCPSLPDLPDLPPQEIAALPVDVLAALQQESEAALKQAKTAKARLEAALVLKYGTAATDARRAAGKDTGTVRFDDGDFTVVADLPKRVSWDQAKLARVAEHIAAGGHDPSEFIETTLRVPERTYTALPADWRNLFDPARTVGSATPRIQLEVGEVT